MARRHRRDKNSYNVCSKCGRYIRELPFKCHRCNQTFCSKHRLPEDHYCKSLEKQNERNQERWQKVIKSTMGSHNDSDFTSSKTNVNEYTHSLK